MIEQNTERTDGLPHANPCLFAREVTSGLHSNASEYEPVVAEVHKVVWRALQDVDPGLRGVVTAVTHAFEGGRRGVGAIESTRNAITAETKLEIRIIYLLLLVDGTCDDRDTAGETATGVAGHLLPLPRPGFRAWHMSSLGKIAPGKFAVSALPCVWLRLTLRACSAWVRSRVQCD